MSRLPVVDDLIGKPFANRGRGPDHFDCWGVVMEVWRRAGITAPDYGVDAMVTQAIDAVYRELLGAAAGNSGPWRQLPGPRPLALVVFHTRPGMVSHIGVCLDAGRFIHVRRNANITIEPLRSPLYCQRVAGYYRYAG